MIAKGIFLIIIILFSAILVLIGLIFFITNWANETKRYTWISIFILAIFSTYFSSTYLAKKISQKAEQAVESVEKGLHTIVEDARITEVDNRIYPDSLSSENQINYLKSLTPNSLRDEIPDSYYYHFGFRDWYRYPLVYPYSLSSTDGVNYASLSDERNVIDISESNDGEIGLGINGITALSFDQRLLLVKTEDFYSSNAIPSYSLFHFDSQEIEQFNDLKSLIKRANNLKFNGSDTLMSMEDYSHLF